jgi:hypothetical protein
MADLPI